MLKRLRTQFVAVIMVIVTIMLCTVFGMLYFFTKSNLEQESLAMMRAVPVGMIAPGQPLAPFARPEEEPEQVRLPFFVVQEEKDGTLSAIGIGYYDLAPGESFDQVFLQELIQEVTRSGRPFGELEQYHLRFLRVDSPFGQRVVFADITSEQSHPEQSGQELYPHRCPLLFCISWYQHPVGCLDGKAGGAGLAEAAPVRFRRLP